MSFLDRQILTKEALNFLQEGQSRNQLSLITRAKAYASPDFISYEDLSKTINYEAMTPLKVSVNENRMRYIVDLSCPRGNTKTDISKVTVPKALSAILDNVSYLENPIDFLVADNYILWDYDLLGDLDSTSPSGIKGYDPSIGLYHELALTPHDSGYTFSVKLFDLKDRVYKTVTYTLSVDSDGHYVLTSDNDNFPCESYAFVTVTRGHLFQFSESLLGQTDDYCRVGTISFNSTKTTGTFEESSSSEFLYESQVFRMYDANDLGTNITKGALCDWTLTNETTTSFTFDVIQDNLDSKGYIVISYVDDGLERLVWLESAGYPCSGYDSQGDDKIFIISKKDNTSAIVKFILGDSLVEPQGDQIVSSDTVTYVKHEGVVYELDMSNKEVVGDCVIVTDKSETIHILMCSNKAVYLTREQYNTVITDGNVEELFNEASKVSVTQYILSDQSSDGDLYTALDVVSCGDNFHSDVRDILFTVGSVRNGDTVTSNLLSLNNLIVNGQNLDTLNLEVLSDVIEDDLECLTLHDLNSQTCYYLERYILDNTVKYVCVGTFNITDYTNSEIPVGSTYDGVSFADIKINEVAKYTEDGISYEVPVYKILDFDPSEVIANPSAEELAIQAYLESLYEDVVVGTLKVQDKTGRIFYGCKTVLKEVPVIFTRADSFHVVTDTNEILHLSGELNTTHKRMTKYDNWCVYTPLMIPVTNFYTTGDESSFIYITDNTSTLLDENYQIGIRTIVLVCDIVETLNSGYTRTVEKPFVVLTNEEFIKSPLLAIHLIETNKYWRVESDECTYEETISYENTGNKTTKTNQMVLKGIHTDNENDPWLISNSDSIECSVLKITTSGYVEFTYKGMQISLPANSLIKNSEDLFTNFGSYLIVFDETDTIVNGEDTLPKQSGNIDIVKSFAFVDFIGYGNLSVPVIGQPYKTSQSMQCITPWHSVTIARKLKHFIVLDVTHIAHWFAMLDSDALGIFTATILNIEKSQTVTIVDDEDP